MKTQIFLQARMGSTRLPGKVLLKIYGKSIIELIVERLKRVKNIDKIVLLTSTNKENEKLVKEAKKLKIEYFQGSEENVLDRFYQASLKFKPQAIIRITADCPLLEPGLITRGLKKFNQGNYDIVSNVGQRTYPHGLDFEIFRQKALAKSWHDQRKKINNDRKFSLMFINPTEYLKENKQFKHKNIASRKNLAHLRLTLDYQEDYLVIKDIYEHLYKNKKDFSLKDILNYLQTKPELLKLNRQHNLF